MPKRTSLEIARLEEARQAHGSAAIADIAEPIAGGWMCYSGPNSWVNLASGLGLAGPVTSRELDRFVSFYAERGAEPRIEVCPFVDPSLTIGLEARRFTLRQFESVLALELDTSPIAPGQRLAEIELIPVDASDPAQSRTYIEIATSGFRDMAAPLDPDLAEITRRILEHEAVTGFLALFAGKPVGAGALEMQGESCALFGTSVLESHRRRGVQQALIEHRLTRAHEQGATLAIIQSRPGHATERNAVRFGFSPAYTKVTLGGTAG